MSELSPVCRVVVLVSGSGSNLQAIIDQAGPDTGYQVVAVLCNRPGAYGLERATQAGIDAVTIDHTSYASREDFDRVLADAIEGYEPDLVLLAGFMRILTPEFVSRFKARLMNIHPSLLPKYPGLHTHQRALDAGDSEAGCTVHFVTEELDGGPPIIQAQVPVKSGDDADTLAKRVLSQEHQIYPLAASWFAEGRLVLENNQSKLDGEALPSTGYPFHSGH